MYHVIQCIEKQGKDIDGLKQCIDQLYYSGPITDEIQQIFIEAAEGIDLAAYTYNQLLLISLCCFISAFIFVLIISCICKKCGCGRKRSKIVYIQYNQNYPPADIPNYTNYPINNRNNNF